MSKRLLLLIVSALRLAVATPIVDAKPQKVAGTHKTDKKKKHRQGLRWGLDARSHARRLRSAA
ncbi:MAG: hypothetical protein WBC33_09540 [Conexibacter sp.]